MGQKREGHPQVLATKRPYVPMLKFWLILMCRFTAQWMKPARLEPSVGTFRGYRGSIVGETAGRCPDEDSELGRAWRGVQLLGWSGGAQTLWGCVAVQKKAREPAEWPERGVASDQRQSITAAACAPDSSTFTLRSLHVPVRLGL